ncbi:DUF2752 domain-containing protein [Plantactinospora sp. GCM10030261]|uniref:DUF2752 domain-containing protein n=1 Tax=Plantactinospora sp. GCM10030261 TaxID=3273420 RepID=UPI0036110E4D
MANVGQSIGHDTGPGEALAHPVADPTGPERAAPEHTAFEAGGPGHAVPGAGHPHYAAPGHPHFAAPGHPAQQAERDRLTRLVLRMHARAPRWVVPLAALGCIGAAMGYTLLSNPTVSAPDAAPTCLLKLTTGLDCPGCGGTRAMWYLLHGDLPAAARHHLVWVFVLPFLIYLYVAWAVERVWGRQLPKLRITPRALGFGLAAWAVFTVARNLPWAPFTAFYV